MYYFCKVKVHEKYMKRCIALAKNGLGTTYPNPLVGSVVVHGNRIIGEGWHREAGGPHAEVNALKVVQDRSLLAEATLYVNLEPCSHFGQTPPCCDLIIHCGIPNVVVGTVDPFERVSGEGIRKLKAAGRQVTVGVLEAECRELNRRFFTFVEKKRPYIILKWAESADGFLAPEKREDREPVWISNRFSRQLTHKWRTEEAAVLAGTNTIIADNPKLDARDWQGNNPVRIVVDRHRRIPADSMVFDHRSVTIRFSESNANVSEVVPEVLATAYQNKLPSLIVEGGAKTLQSFIDAGLWDEARVFKSPVYLYHGISSPFFNGNPIERITILEDVLTIYRNS